MSYPPPSGQGYAGYPPQQGGYPPQQQGYPPQQGAGYPPQQGGYPPAQGGYPPPTNPQSGYPSAQGSYPPSSQYPPPSQGGYPPPTNPQSGYPPPTNPQQGGYPPPSAQGYPPAQGGYPPQQGGYPPQQQGYPPQQGAGYPPQQGGYPPAQGGYPPPTNPQSGYPSAQGSYPPSSQYPPTSQGSSSLYPPSQKPGYPTQPGYPPATGGYPPQQQPGGYGPPPTLQGAPQIWYEQYNSQVSQQNQQIQWAWFTSMDKDRSGEISASELAQLNLNNRVVGVDLARKLIAIFDKDRSGQISFPEYSALSQFLSILTEWFQKGEQKGRSPGYIPVGEIQFALQAAGFALTPNAAVNVAKRFDTQKRGVLTWEEYLALAAHVGLLRSIFEWSDSDRDGKVTFDFESFAYATLYL